MIAVRAGRESCPPKAGMIVPGLSTSFEQAYAVLRRHVAPPPCRRAPVRRIPAGMMSQWI